MELAIGYMVGWTDERMTCPVQTATNLLDFQRTGNEMALPVTASEAWATVQVDVSQLAGFRG